MSPFYMILTELRENSKVVSSDFSMKKNIVALSSSSLPIKLIVTLNQNFLIQLVCLNLLELVYNALKSIHSLINYQLCNHYLLLMSIFFSYASSLFFTGTSKKLFPPINTLKSFISTFGA